MKTVIKFVALTLILPLVSSVVQAAVPSGTTTKFTASGFVAGGSNVTFTSFTPMAATYKVWLQIPKGSKATNALYRVYPKGNLVGNTTCLSTDATYPCFEVPVNQALNQGKWLQLKSGNTAQWDFVKGGFVTVNSANLAATELLGIATVRFDNGYPTTGYSKISNSGALLPNSAVLGTGANAWACTRNNVTGLMWEVKTNDSGLRDKDNTYSWYDPNPATNGGFAGYQSNGDGGFGQCTGGILCNTNAYATAVNTQKLCGFADWKMPSSDNLLELVNTAYTPTINPTYFPNTQSSWFWSSSPYASSSGFAWIVYFDYGNVGNGSKNGYVFVRLVRGGQ